MFEKNNNIIVNGAIHRYAVMSSVSKNIERAHGIGQPEKVIEHYNQIDWLILMCTN